MSNETYTLLDAMREEIDFLSELKKLSDKEEKHLLSAHYAHQHSMLKRIVNRFENGKEYYLGIKDGETYVMTRQTTRHLEREYPAVAKAKQNLDTVTDLVKGNN
jgi:hypothetical protein